MSDFDLFYSNHPWAGLETNQRQWYVPFLREIYMREAIYSRFVSNQFALTGPNSPVTTKMTITSLIPPHANFDPIALRQMWLPASYADTFAREIEFRRYGGKMALHDYDQMITYWQLNGNRGLKPIIDRYLGGMMTETFDMQARNTFFEAPYTKYGQGGSDFASITNWSGHKFTTELIDNVRLGMAERGMPFTVMPNVSFQSARPLCITSPGVIRDLINETDPSATNPQNQFIDVMRYADAGRIIRGEVGIYHNTRFVETPRAILYNSGPFTKQAAITAPVAAGDGATSNKVDKVRQVGQPGVSRFVQVDDASGFAKNDIVTIHVRRTDRFGVANGVDHNDGLLTYRRVEEVDLDSDTLSFDLPIMVDMNVSLGSGIYGYITKGRHVHTALFIGGMDGVVLGVGRAPRIHTPIPVDDFESMYRISWDSFHQHQLFEPEVFEVWYGAGTNATKSGIVQ